jgi:hypothetical protein
VKKKTEELECFPHTAHRQQHSHQKRKTKITILIIYKEDARAPSTLVYIVPLVV